MIAGSASANLRPTGQTVKSMSGSRRRQEHRAGETSINPKSVSGLCVAVIISTGLWTPPAVASLVTDPTASNEPSIPSGSVFATVTVTASSTSLVHFEVTGDFSILSGGGNPGIDGFGFNHLATTGPLTFSNLPSGNPAWTFGGSGTLDGFGVFLQAENSGIRRNPSLTFDVTTANSFGSLAAIEAASVVPNASGDHFAVHIGGFNSYGGTGATSAFSSESAIDPLPEPSTLLLFSSAGLAGWTGLRKRRKRGSRRA